MFTQSHPQSTQPNQHDRPLVGIMSLSKLIRLYSPWITPQFCKGMPPELLKISLEAKFWRLSGYGAMPNICVRELEQFLESGNTQPQPQRRSTDAAQIIAPVKCNV
jgi:hypothetical protein